MGDELIGGRVVGVRLTLASPALVRWGAKATGGEAGGQGAAGDKGPATPPPSPLVINESAHRTRRARQLTPESPLLFGVVTFPTPLIDEPPPPRIHPPSPFFLVLPPQIMVILLKEERGAPSLQLLGRRSLIPQKTWRLGGSDSLKWRWEETPPPPHPLATPHHNTTTGGIFQVASFLELLQKMSHFLFFDS